MIHVRKENNHEKSDRGPKLEKNENWLPGYLLKCSAWKRF